MQGLTRFFVSSAFPPLTRFLSGATTECFVEYGTLVLKCSGFPRQEVTGRNPIPPPLHIAFKQDSIQFTIRATNSALNALPARNIAASALAQSGSIL